MPRPSDNSIDTLIRNVLEKWENPKELPEKQRRAIELLIAGNTYSDIANQLGIDRGTLYRWRNKDEDFRHTLELAREEALGDSGSRVRELVPRALAVLESHLAKDNLQAAVRILNLAGLDAQEAARSVQSRMSVASRLKERLRK